MEKMWAGRFEKATDKVADDFNSSIHFDSKMYKQDIKGSMCHAAMLAEQGIIPEADAEKIIAIKERYKLDAQVLRNLILIYDRPEGVSDEPINLE